METLEKYHSKFSRWLRNSITVRLISISILTMLLLIPLSYIENLIYERQSREETVVREINEKWGEEVLVYGPIFKIPYKTYVETTKENSKTKEIFKERKAQINSAYFFPNVLDVRSELQPELKNYGIYNSVVYKGNLSGEGIFEELDFTSENIANEDILWEQARIIIRTSNLKGISNKVKIRLNGKEFEFEPKYFANQNLGYGNKLQSLESELISKEYVPDFKNVKFSFNIEYNGSKQLRIVPIGEETKLRVKSVWESPSFIGNYLPYNSDKLSDEGFDAKWKVLNINRAFSQAFFGTLPDLDKFAFGVKLMLPVDEYQQSTRSAKYGLLVIALTFLVFFLFQTISKVNIHPFQYLMIGFALTMFYTLLISISEHSNFALAYLISGTSVVILITLYSISILKSIKFSSFIAFSLIVLYAFIYIIIQMESYALITGSIGLFAILAIVMYVSKKIEWNFKISENSDPKK